MDKTDKLPKTSEDKNNPNDKQDGAYRNEFN